MVHKKIPCAVRKNARSRYHDAEPVIAPEL
jgi:hypothetical protein